MDSAASTYNSGQLETYFQLWYKRLCYFAFKLVNDRSGAEDIVQDTFIKYWNRRDDFNNENAVKSFLYITVRNACLNFARHEAVERKYTASHQIQEGADGWGLDQIIRAEVMGEINKAIEELPEGCRQVLKLAFFENLKNDEIAQHLGVSINTIKTQKQRAIQLLRLRLDITTFYLLLLLLNE